MHYTVIKTENGFEVASDGILESPPLAFKTKREALECAKELNAPLRSTDESIGSVMTGRDWD